MTKCRMTREEAIDVLKKSIDESVEMTIREWEEFDKKVNEAMDMAIEALQIDIVYCYECKYNGSCCQCVDIIDDLLSLNFCGRGERKEVEE